MPLFGRRKADAALGSQDDVVEDELLVSSAASVGDDELDESARRQRARLRPRDEIDRSNGPFDRSEKPDGDLLDFGALLIGGVDGVELRLDVDEQTQLITGMTAILTPDGSAAVQLQVFAAPKTSGIWYGIRREIADAVITAGGSADEVDGPLGTELHARMPKQGPQGGTTFEPVRFVGVDGPRWFLRGVLSGEAAVNETVAARAIEVIRQVVVQRGDEPRAPRELLELTIPADLLEQPEPDVAAE